MPLSPLAVTLCKEIRALAGDSEWMFPSPQNKGRPIVPGAVTAALRRNLGVLGLKNICVHDMRRAASTGLASIGVPPVVREHILNHSQGKLDQAYDLHDYLEEKKSALQRWAERLSVILRADEKVVELERSA